jgi:hypothetical protein
MVSGKLTLGAAHNDPGNEPRVGRQKGGSSPALQPRFVPIRPRSLAAIGRLTLGQPSPAGAKII